jgi:DNA-binding MarR family transcriptional regulator
MRQSTEKSSFDEILVPSPCVSNKIGIIYRTITRAYNQVMKPYGISTIQRSILMFVKHASPVNQKTISRVLAMEKSTCSRDMKSLLQKKYLQAINGEDARNTIFMITEKGQKLLEITTPIWQEIHSKTTALLGKMSIDELDRIIISFKKNPDIYK